VPNEATTDAYTLSPDEAAYLEACAHTAKHFGWPLHIKIDTSGLRVKVGDETWSLPMGVNLDRSAVVELPDTDGPYDPRD
jgi:hypothetical protein